MTEKYIACQRFVKFNFAILIESLSFGHGLCNWGNNISFEHGSNQNVFHNSPVRRQAGHRSRDPVASQHLHQELA